MNDKINNDGKEIQNIDNTVEASSMSEDNRNAIKEKLIKMEEYLQELQKYKPDNYQSYISDKKVKYAIERLLQLIIDLALDINNIVIKNEGGYPASDYFKSFIDLIELKVFTEQFARKIAPVQD